MRSILARRRLATRHQGSRARTSPSTMPKISGLPNSPGRNRPSAPKAIDVMSSSAGDVVMADAVTKRCIRWPIPRRPSNALKRGMRLFCCARSMLAFVNVSPASASSLAAMRLASGLLREAQTL